MIFKIKKPKNLKTAQAFEADSLKNRNWKKDKEPPELKKMRSSSRWQKIREMKLSSEPLCRSCRRPAEHLHHIAMAINSPELFFELDNLLPLCEDCHVKVHSALRRGLTIEDMFLN